MNAHELAMRLADNAAAIASHLLPAGKKQSGEWKVGSLNGEEGRSLSIRLSGDKRGVWRDFAADDGGDLLDLWAKVRGQSISEAMTDVKAYLGIRDQIPARQVKEYKRPPKPKGQKAKGRVLEWLAGRGLNDSTIEAFKVAEQIANGKTIAVFPFLRDGELINVKYRDLDDKRGMRQEAGAEACLFGWHLIDPKVRAIAITEGEIDAMTLHQCGIPALSVNQGAGAHQWIENDWDRLERFSEIFVCFDDDQAGQKGASEVVQRLGIERCRIVTFGAKDANQWLQDGASGEDFHSALKGAKYMDPEELVSIADFFAQVKSLLHPAASDPTYPRLMVGERYADEFEFRPGEVSVYTGINGHGKSLKLNQILIGLMVQHQRVCVFSGEMTPAQQGKRLARQLAGSSIPTPAYIDVIGDWLRDRYWLFNVLGGATIDRLIEVFRYGARRYGITQFVIDSLMMTDVPEDGPGAFSAQKIAIQKLATFAKQFRVHVHLVAHPRKGRDEKMPPGKMDVSGSGKITDGADNVFSVWSAGKDPGDEDNGKPDALLELLKQRNGDLQHRKYWLFFNQPAQQYCASPMRKAVSFVPFIREIAAQEQEHDHAR